MDTFSRRFRRGATGDHNRRTFAAIHVNHLIKILSEFRAALTERGVLPAHDSIDYELEEISYPLEELAKYFAGDSSNTLNKKSSYIFAFFVKHQFTKIRKIASEIDEEYESETPEVPVDND